MKLAVEIHGKVFERLDAPIDGQCLGCDVKASYKGCTLYSKDLQAVCLALDSKKIYSIWKEVV